MNGKRPADSKQPAPSPKPLAPSPWIERFAKLAPRPNPNMASEAAANDSAVLDLACGGGRHSRYFLDLGYNVVAIDRDLGGIADLADHPRLESRQADLENGDPFPFAGRHFAAVVVTNYLYRPLFPALIAAVAPGGILLYETFAKGNEHFGKPRNPAHLLRPGELLDAVRGRLRVVAYEDLIVEEPWPAAVQRICAINEAESNEEVLFARFA